MDRDLLLKDLELFHMNVARSIANSTCRFIRYIKHSGYVAWSFSSLVHLLNFTHDIMRKAVPSLVHRESGCFFISPAIKNSGGVGTTRYAVIPGNMPPQTPVRSFGNYASIVRLGSVWNPCAIFWAVAKRIIHSLNRESGPVSIVKRPISEHDKIIPLRTDCYSFPKIVFVARIRAPVPHVFPLFMQSGFREPMCFCHSLGIRHEGLLRKWFRRCYVVAT